MYVCVWGGGLASIVAVVKLTSIEQYAFPHYWVLIAVLLLEHVALAFPTQEESVSDREEERMR